MMWVIFDLLILCIIVFLFRVVYRVIIVKNVNVIMWFMNVVSVI